MRYHVLLIDDDDDLRASIADLVELCGKRCLALASLSELVQRRGDALPCDLAIVDVNLGAARPSGIEAYEWLKREGFGGRVVFLTGHAPSHPLVMRAQRIGQTCVFAKPIAVEQLQLLFEVGSS